MKSLSEFVIFEANHEQRVDEAKRKAAIAAKKVELQADYNAFLDVRDYVQKNIHLLKGQKIPIEVMNIQVLPSHECVILEDLLLLSYGEVEPHIRKVEEMKKKVLEANSLDKGECPKCQGAVEKKNLFFYRGVGAWGLQCVECNEMYDYMGQFDRLIAAHDELRKSGRMIE